VNQASFNCPYCCSDIPVQASVCRHCARDLLPFKPMALRLQTLVEEVAQLNALVQQQAQALVQLQSRQTHAATWPCAETTEVPPEETPRRALAPARPWLSGFGFVMLTITAIGLCHWLLLFIYDAPPLFLRLLTITLPALSGYFCARSKGMRWPIHMTAALWVAAGSVGLMLYVTSSIDGVPLLPTNPREWRETMEYTVAIGLAFITGHLVHRLLNHWRQQQRHKINLSVLLARDANGQFKITEISTQVQSLITATAPLVSAGVALYSGLKTFTS
jgi:hypothetical protein